MQAHSRGGELKRQGALSEPVGQQASMLCSSSKQSFRAVTHQVDGRSFASVLPLVRIPSFGSVSCTVATSWAPVGNF